MKYFVEHSIIESPEGCPLLIPTSTVDVILDELCKDDVDILEPSDLCLTPDDYHDTGLRFYIAVDGFDPDSEVVSGESLAEAREGLQNYLFDLYDELFHSS